MEKFKTELISVHNKECDAYCLLKNVSDFPKAEVYFFEYRSEEHPGVIVMEYLDKAITTGLFRSVTAQQCLNVAKHFGTFQVNFNN
jgi:hypothetical protein